MDRALAAAMACALASCGGPTATEPTVTTVSLPKLGLEDGGAPTVLVAAIDDASAAVDATSPPPSTDGCRGTSFDLDHLPDGCSATSAQAQAARDPAPEVDAKLVADTARIASGKELGFTLTLTNTTGADLEIVMKPSCAAFEPEAYAGATRADYVNVDCGFGRGCGGFARRIVLSPGGTLVKHVRFTARVRRVSSQTGCDEVDAGGMRPGRYELRLGVNPFFPLAKSVEKARSPFEVVR